MCISKDELFGKYITFDKDVPYKDFMVKPIKVKDFWELSMPLGMLDFPKNEMGSIELIQMPYMAFWLSVMIEHDETLGLVETFLRAILDIGDDEVIQITYDLKEIRVGRPIGTTRDGYEILAEGHRTIDCDDFDEIKRIVLYYSVVDYTEEYVSQEVRQATEDYFRLKSNGKGTSMEHKVRCLSLAMEVSKETIGEMSLRDFNLYYEALSNYTEYGANRIAESQGVKFKKPLESWLYDEHKNKYDMAFCDADAFESYVAGAN